MIKHMLELDRDKRWTILKIQSALHNFRVIFVLDRIYICTTVAAFLEKRAGVLEIF